MRLPEKPRRHGYVDEQINEAMARGDFENLKGKGEPLDLKGDLSDRATMRTKLRHDAGYTAPWEEVAREIGSLTQKAETELRRAVQFYRAGISAPKANIAKIEADFRAALKQVQVAVQAANSAILRHNLLLPQQLPHLYKRRVQLSELMNIVAPDLKHWAE